MVGTIGTRLFDMLLDDDMTDVTFVVQGTEIKAHRVVASSHGGVLKDLLKNNAQRVDLGDDFAPHTFKTVLQYLYTDTCDISDMNIFDLLHAAGSLKLTDLDQRCAKVVANRLTDTNAGKFCEQALYFENKETILVCQKYYCTNARNIIRKKEFLEISQETLVKFCEVLRTNYSEVELFSGCVEWARNKCRRSKLQGSPEELRKALGVILEKIQFASDSMTFEEFRNIVIPTGILSHEDVGRIICDWKVTDSAEISTKDILTEVKVTVSGCFGEINVTKTIPLCTKVKELKRTIKTKWKLTGSEDMFTLGLNGKELADDTRLCTIYDGKDLVVEIYSYTVNVKKVGSDSQFQVLIKGEDCRIDLGIIRGYVFARHKIQCDAKKLVVHRDGEELNLNVNYVWPGETVHFK